VAPIFHSFGCQLYSRLSIIRGERENNLWGKFRKRKNEDISEGKEERRKIFPYVEPKNPEQGSWGNLHIISSGWQLVYSVACYESATSVRVLTLSSTVFIQFISISVWKGRDRTCASQCPTMDSTKEILLEFHKSCQLGTNRYLHTTKFLWTNIFTVPDYDMSFAN